MSYPSGYGGWPRIDGGWPIGGAGRSGGWPGNAILQGLSVIRSIATAAYDISDIRTLNQVSTGTTPVTAVTQPIGLMLDKHLGLQFGPELITNGGFDTDTAWVKTSNWTISGGVASFSPATATNDILYELNRVVVGKMYRITYDLTRITGSTMIFAGSSGAGVVRSATGSYAEYIVASGNATLYIFALAGFTGSIDNISVKLLDGNHALQATAASRPTWQVDANGHYYAQFLGTDDSLSCATGGGGSTGFLFCAALKPTGGAGVGRILFDDRGTNTGYLVCLETSNVLQFRAGNGSAYTIKGSTATVDVGTTAMQTVWDDGINLNVQANGGLVETVARPSVVAGSAGYTLFKSNLAASAFLPADFYRAVYIKNWAGTSAQLAAIQAWVKAGAGL